MIPDSQQWGPIPPPEFRDADGCAVFPGSHSWSSDPDASGFDARALHVPFSLGEIEQFEMAWDCDVLDTGYDIEEEEKLLSDLVVDPLIGQLADHLLGIMPSSGGELAVEV